MSTDNVIEKSKAPAQILLFASYRDDNRTLGAVTDFWLDPETDAQEIDAQRPFREYIPYLRYDVAEKMVEQAGHVSEDIISMTREQKLSALALKFYYDRVWTPKEGDYYTSSRDDLELYQIVSVTDETITTRYCDSNKTDSTTVWNRADFTTEGFGPKRVWVPDFIIEGTWI